MELKNKDCDKISESLLISDERQDELATIAAKNAARTLVESGFSNTDGMVACAKAANDTQELVYVIWSFSVGIGSMHEKIKNQAPILMEILQHK